MSKPMTKPSPPKRPVTNNEVAEWVIEDMPINKQYFGWEIRARKLIVAALKQQTELLALMEKAKIREAFTGHLASRAIFRENLVDAIESYLSGDPGPLKKLAGDK
jgi:hypothetical protein